MVSERGENASCYLNTRGTEGENEALTAGVSFKLAPTPPQTPWSPEDSAKALDKVRDRRPSLGSTTHCVTLASQSTHQSLSSPWQQQEKKERVGTNL